MARTTKTTARKTTRHPKIEKNYPDTEGHKLSDDGKVTVKKDKAEIRSLKQAKQPKVKEYQGSPILATRLFQRTMPQFSNCRATCLLVWNEQAGTVTFLNVYNDILPASYRPEKYTYTYKAKTHDPKMAEMTEVEVTDWPAFIQNAHATKRKARTGK